MAAGCKAASASLTNLSVTASMWPRIRLICAPSIMKAISHICQPHFGHSSGKTSSKYGALWQFQGRRNVLPRYKLEVLRSIGQALVAVLHYQHTLRECGT